MRVSILSLLAMIYGVVAVHGNYEEEVPLHNQELVQDDVDELESK